MTDNTALILCLDQNRKIIREDGGIGMVYYEDEAVRCVESWRKNGGGYSDIPIYLFNFKKDLNPALIRYFLGVEGTTVVDAYKLYPENLDRRLFVNTMLAQTVAEQAHFIPEEFLIYTDLDMILMSEPRFGNLDGHVIIGEYRGSDKMTPELAYRF